MRTFWSKPQIKQMNKLTWHVPMPASWFFLSLWEKYKWVSVWILATYLGWRHHHMLLHQLQQKYIQSFSSTLLKRQAFTYTFIGPILGQNRNLKKFCRFRICFSGINKFDKSVPHIFVSSKVLVLWPLVVMVKTICVMPEIPFRWLLLLLLLYIGHKQNSQ